MVPYDKEYASQDKSMIELVFAPCNEAAGSDVNWIGKSDEAGSAAYSHDTFSPAQLKA